MILSIHIRKCAGTSLRHSLSQAYGPAVHFDYGDEIGSSWPSSRAKRTQKQSDVQSQKTRLKRDIRLIHGHYFPHKYDVLDGPKRYVTLLRDPVARVVSNYHYIKRNPARRHPDALIVNALGFSLTEFAQHPDNRNLQFHSLQGMALDRFASVGLVETYEASIARLSAVLDVELSSGEPQNVNPNQSLTVGLTAKERAVIEACNSEDLRLYDQARELFEKNTWAA